MDTKQIEARKAQTQKAQDIQNQCWKAWQKADAILTALKSTQDIEAVPTHVRQQMLDSIPSDIDSAYNMGYEAGTQDTMDRVDPCPADTLASALHELKEILINTPDEADPETAKDSRDMMMNIIDRVLEKP